MVYFNGTIVAYLFEKMTYIQYIRPAYKYVAVRTTAAARGQCATRYLSCVYHVIKWDLAKSFHSRLLKYATYTR